MLEDGKTIRALKMGALYAPFRLLYDDVSQFVCYIGFAYNLYHLNHVPYSAIMEQMINGFINRVKVMLVLIVRPLFSKNFVFLPFCH